MLQKISHEEFSNIAIDHGDLVHLKMPVAGYETTGLMDETMEPVNDERKARYEFILIRSAPRYNVPEILETVDTQTGLVEFYKKVS